MPVFGVVMMLQVGYLFAPPAVGCLLSILDSFPLSLAASECRCVQVQRDVTIDIGGRWNDPDETLISLSHGRV